MRRTKATFSPNVEAGVHRVVDVGCLAGEWTPDLRFVVLARSAADREFVARLMLAGTTNVGWVESDDLAVDDVIARRAGRGDVHVLFRESDVHHTLFLTNRCNSYCLMCSQPPTAQDDSWLIDEALDVVCHMRLSPRTIGLSGGEPLLLGSALHRILDAIRSHHPETAVEVLTNGRLLANDELAKSLLHGLERTSWLVPLYGHADFVHDFVVQTPGAFDETLAGLLNLQELEQPVQLRVVLIEPVLRILPELCRFIGRNLPFVREVALMGCEPIGFALANREQCEVDLLAWADTLKQSARVLKRHAIPYLFMNAPLCALPHELRPDARQSISDWKNVYAAECDKCAVKGDCSGLFAWHERGWKPTKIAAIEEAIT